MLGLDQAFFGRLYATPSDPTAEEGSDYCNYSGKLYPPDDAMNRAVTAVLGYRTAETHPTVPALSTTGLACLKKVAASSISQRPLRTLLCPLFS